MQKPLPTTRRLKIERAGDPFAQGIIPRLRLCGKWFEAAGFKPGTHVTLNLLEPGLIQLQASLPESEAKPLTIG